MRFTEQHPRPLEDLRTRQVDHLKQWIDEELEDAYSARAPQERVWRENLRLYEGIPRIAVKNVPIENAPNIEVPLGAIAADSIYAQALELIFTVAPIVTCRPNGREFVPHAKALQRFINLRVEAEFGLRLAVENTLLDDVQLGTGFYYTPFVDYTKKTKVHTITSRGPRIFSMPVEDLLMPGGAYSDPQAARWAAMRFWLTEGEMNLRAKALNWDIEHIAPVGNVGWVRARRESLGRTNSSQRLLYLYEPHDIYCYFDIDGDGQDEDLHVTYDRTSKTILSLQYNPYDVRPIDIMQYQRRAHLPYGMGVIEMLRSLQEETSDLHNERTLNLRIANTRLWKAKLGSVPENMKIWPNKVIMMTNPEDLVPEQLGDVYPSAAQAEAITISLAERRAGINDLSLPRPTQVLGSRTPGITALSLLQQVNKRFTPAFDGVRLATASAVRQCLYRYQERLLAGDQYIADHMAKILGAEDAALVIEVLRNPDFDEAVSVELTASSASVNRDADRQNAILLANMLSQYYEKIIQLVMLAANPQVPQAVREVAIKISQASAEAVDRTVRAFESVRDPETFVVHAEEQVGQLADMAQQGLLGLGAIFGGLTGQEGEGGGGGGAPRPNNGSRNGSTGQGQSVR